MFPNNSPFQEKSFFGHDSQFISIRILDGISLINTSQNPCQTAALPSLQVFVCFLSYQNRFSALANSNLETVCIGGAPHQKNVLMSAKEQPYHLGKRIDTSPSILFKWRLYTDIVDNLFLAVCEHWESK